MGNVLLILTLKVSNTKILFKNTQNTKEGKLNINITIILTIQPNKFHLIKILISKVINNPNWVANTA